MIVVGWVLVPLTTFARDNGDEDSVLPGDGVHGLELRHKVNQRKATIKDRSTGLIRDMKTDHGGVHGVDNPSTWTRSGTDPDGTLFTEFLDMPNNCCDRHETEPCNSKADCAAVEGKCGFAGKRDWRIPNVRELQSIVDYEVFGPAIHSDFGPTLRTATGHLPLLRLSRPTRGLCISPTGARAPPAKTARSGRVPCERM